jgi:hypothetical protein
VVSLKQKQQEEAKFDHIVSAERLASNLSSLTSSVVFFCTVLSLVLLCARNDPSRQRKKTLFFPFFFHRVINTLPIPTAFPVCAIVSSQAPAANTTASAPVTTTAAAPVTTTAAPVTEAPVTEAPVTEAPATEAPVPSTAAPATTTAAPATDAPITSAPATNTTMRELTNRPVGPTTTTRAPDVDGTTPATTANGAPDTALEAMKSKVAELYNAENEVRIGAGVGVGLAVCCLALILICVCTRKHPHAPTPAASA